MRTEPTFCALPIALLAASVVLAAPATASLPDSTVPPAPGEDVAMLERTGTAPDSDHPPTGVDLSGEELESVTPEESHVLSRPWYENIDISGFGAVGFLDSGDDGSRTDGGFLVKEVSFFLEGWAWKDASVYLETQMNQAYYGAETPYIRTGEAHVRFRNVLDRWGVPFGVKLGRVDIPFGEEYLRQDSRDNPFISFSAAYPYGIDEGIVAYGKLAGTGWVAAVTDGSDDRSLDDNPDKAVNLKIHRDLSGSVYASASAMRNGRTAESAFQFGGSHFEPIVGGPSQKSSKGSTGSSEVGAWLYSLDAKYHQDDAGEFSATFGQARVDDKIDEFDRTISWFVAETVLRLSPSVYVGGRYSEIGTYASGEGYHFEGKATADGEAAYGFDVKRLQRTTFVAGWKPNPHVGVKLEVGDDRYDLIDASPDDPRGDSRLLLGGEVVLSF